MAEGERWTWLVPRLRHQVTLGVTVGFILVASLFGYLILKVTSASTEVIGAERLKIAATAAAAIDTSVGHAASQLAEFARLDAVRRAIAGQRADEDLEQAYRLIGAYAEVVVLDATGATVWEHSYRPDEPAVSYRDEPIVRTALATATPEVALLKVTAYDHPPVVAVAVPVLAGERASGLVVGLLHFAHTWNVPLVPLPAGDANFVAVVVDEEGRILAGMHTEQVEAPGSADAPMTMDQHAALLRPLFVSRRPGVLIHHAASEAHFVAFAPLMRLPVGVVIEEERDVALAVPSRLQRMLASLGAIVLVLTAAAAWAHARLVTRPLESLAGAMRRVAAGGLDEPLALSRRDEIGMLARSFETMRVGLARAMEERDRWERELEARVRDRTAEVRRLLAKIIHAQEEERRRLSRELHDDTAQAIATLLVHLGTVQRKVAPDHDAAAMLAQIQTHGTRTLRELRRMIADLRPTVLDDLGLIPALRDYLDATLRPCGVIPTVRVVGEPRRLPGPVETALFRILQEAISNIARHAAARTATLDIEFAPARVVAAVRDDGHGFDVRRRGVGLEGMRERAELIHARLGITSESGRGTVVRVEVPDETSDA